uniref:Protein kinase domain-containing protein n=1 Tax=Setaria italica TaxID=4555 RepID=K3XSR7_SETIT
MTVVLLPSLLLQAVAFLLQLSVATSQTSEPEQQGCSPKACGDLNISYPFWLEEPGRPPCGSPPFQLKCNGSGAFLTHSMFQAYRVVRIFTQNNSFHVVDENLPLATGCPAPCFNISLAMGLGAFAISKANSELRFLSRCDETVPEVLPGFRRLPCDNYSFVGFGRRYGSSSVLREIPQGCLVSVVPTLPVPAPDHRHDYVANMRKGFLLEWTVVSGDCSKCTASGGECMYPDNGLGFSCNCPDGIHYPMNCVLMTVAASLLLPCMYVLIWHRKGQKLCSLFCKTSMSNNERNIEALLVSHGSLAPKRYKYSEATKITSSMNNKLGEGGYGVVFKGRLHDGRLVAVKFLHDSKAKGEEFVNEVMSIGRTSHVNIVSLYGFCLEGSKRALIYEYMSNGSLDKYIYSKNPKQILGWERLYAIAVGIAHGLEYLHHSCNTRIVHFDIKPQNILLDDNFCPKIADFGLAKLCCTKDSKLSVTGARGTIGFIAPEVHSRTFGVVSIKSDVYSYGMLLLEMVGGRKNVKSVVDKSSQNYFPDWIYNHYAQHDGLQACEVTPEVEEIAKKMSLIGLWCIQILPMHRPTITKVLEMFERGLDELEMPSKQNFSQVL